MATNENISSSVLNRLIKEVKDYTKQPVSDVTLQVNEENVTDLRAEISGPAETPFHGGVFKIKLVFGPDFPSAPPKGFFITPIFHPNIAKNGEICVNTLKKDWKSDCKLGHILMVVRCLLIEPNPESALNEEAGRLFMEDYESYFQRAQLMTKIHATRESAPTEKNIESIGGEKPSSISTAGKKEEKKKDDKKRSLKRL
ncbi:hypothetical protein GUITHDRAFT_84623 [Guillardia theta CCMP2712]|uniref:E2 ubiquitin-conjugating enzyme n=2 Tax=Guillardia theta TaxID=55529 RepID=L1JWM9_GUITC|nr:hypothetical protein GUITHDRAFT_84623 [Guillardia theta CCMP2712]EKX52503.1 hypothetical protein GUITHDRAFT_84623 [Guillardia theta CCMP2712]|mmetsp:Transcript_4536/g.16559  ORF Transcript_4536/g.16559 Transcript_4536/m.16559 type:complete len:199 (+) Transcript_4536:97-693(+)|eukprot:XP_005839483.1 hypothetical protein GUITHDRAFT_84623 [Guillardia theta CCMP2712]